MSELKINFTGNNVAHNLTMTMDITITASDRDLGLSIIQLHPYIAEVSEDATVSFQMSARLDDEPAIEGEPLTILKALHQRLFNRGAFKLSSEKN